MADVLDVKRWTLREWDSAFFAVRIAQVAGTRATAEELSQAVEEARAEAVDCLYFLAEADDHDTVRAAEAAGFGLVDVRLTLECEIKVGGQEGPPLQESTDRVTRLATEDDLPALTALARSSHRNTRFHTDPHFDRSRSDELYAVWIERSVRGELADVVWVVDVDGGPRGYLTASREAGHAKIGLVAVHTDYRGRGYGEQLLRTVLQWVAEQDRRRVSVVTQGQSAAAVRFYERGGFTTSAVRLWYHRWLR